MCFAALQLIGPWRLIEERRWLVWGTARAKNTSGGQEHLGPVSPGRHLKRVGAVKTEIGLPAAFCAALFLTFASISPVEAAKRQVPPPKAPTAYASAKAPMAVNDISATSSIAPAANANCIKSRKRLWVEEEGWIVRRV